MANKTAVALGNFDGIHSGHRAVLENAVKVSHLNGLNPVALLFDCHPKNFLNQNIGLLMSDSDKVAEIEHLGLTVKRISFEHYKNFSPKEFVEEVLEKELNCDSVFCGNNYHFGKGGSGTTEDLTVIAKRKGIKVFISESSQYKNETVSSSRIRNALANGEVSDANKMLEKPFSYNLEVVHGQSRGKAIGFPTINQYFPPELVIPKFGVYVSSSEIDGKIYPSFTNIGYRPTFPENDVRSETHIFDFDGDLYSKKIRVRLYDFVREEKMFDGVDSLIKQLSSDKELAKKYFEKQKP